MAKRTYFPFLALRDVNVIRKFFIHTSMYMIAYRSHAYRFSLLTCNHHIQIKNLVPLKMQFTRPSNIYSIAYLRINFVFCQIFKGFVVKAIPMFCVLVQALYYLDTICLLLFSINDLMFIQRDQLIYRSVLSAVYTSCKLYL